jgi:hypothetical protein
VCDNPKRNKHIFVLHSGPERERVQMVGLRFSVESIRNPLRCGRNCSELQFRDLEVSFRGEQERAVGERDRPERVRKLQEFRDLGHQVQPK